MNKTLLNSSCSVHNLYPSNWFQTDFEPSRKLVLQNLFKKLFACIHTMAKFVLNRFDNVLKVLCERGVHNMAFINHLCTCMSCLFFQHFVVKTQTIENLQYLFRYESLYDYRIYEWVKIRLYFKDMVCGYKHAQQIDVL